MTLENSLTAYADKYLTPDNEWYLWRNINPRYLPTGIVLPMGNQYAQNVSLKHQLSNLYSNGNDDAKISATKYYIAVWGGVRRNGMNKIKNYSLASPDSLIVNGVQGIASWSKALCIRDPNNYAIYDARVALSLNAIQVISRAQSPILYPLLKGQNKLINKGSKHMHEYACKNEWPKTDQTDFYQRYNAILSATANTLNVSHYSMEMLLFSHAPNLLRIAFSNEHF